jgi:hypothetical protein
MAPCMFFGLASLVRNGRLVPIRNCQIEIGPTAAAACGRIASGTPSRLFQTTECMDCYNDYWGGYVFLLFQVF